MAKLSVLFLMVFSTCLLDQYIVSGNWHLVPSGKSFMAYHYTLPKVESGKPDYFNSAESDNSSESSSSESSESSSSESSESSSSESSESASSESSESSEDSSSESSESTSSEVSSSEKSKESAENDGSKEKSSSEETPHSEEDSKESEEKKKETPKKKKKKEHKSLFPPRTYTFPSRQVQQIIYSAASPYTYLPYRSSYVVQQPVASYPVKSSYQYVSMPASAPVVKSYTAAPVIGRLVGSPVQRIVYSSYSPSGISYAPVAKAVMSPGSRVYSIPASWNSGLSFFKK